MADVAPLPPFAAIVVAAGAGLRAGQPLPKQFAPYRGKPLLRHSVERLLAAGSDPVAVVIPLNAETIAEEILTGLENVVLVTGGATRQTSVMHGLLTIIGPDIEHVLIHDAARPDVPRDVIERLLGALETSEGAIPVLPVVDSIAVAQGDRMQGKADRETLRRVQTPQAFRMETILAAHEAWQGQPDAGDDAQVLMANGGEVRFVAGDERLKKITFAEDFVDRLPLTRTGMGFDVHRLVEGEELWLAGLKLDHDKGLSGHSDADVALHAITDALLGSVGAGDIGDHFPPSDPQWKGASSDRFLAHAGGLVAEAGFAIASIDLTIICEAPKIGPHRDAMRNRIADILQCDPARVSVKATTTERLGFTGRGEGIAAQAIATVQSS
ncbi:bifunctional 2-C-methyl-D-erythritol 4-phosphate cytidylyltransferase/2-C-methyl-D-erythritol 2,4-cyclodiphosphate synthase [Qipengyuania oceanensis]|uniref:Bifunctional enzyme IspD/IspF n=1 Tax=Qipengyuania oceanensis TaxID=1463597 RepID=A0A844YCN9_9SPHN|nr:bifunctional 2-C-methyl-D-erythritol 4-phosphate cytidylyltransferase/2-C-methyl-D-erythritol 2,4-cyclodiphosphate synthase [Qipengyuania oceanensis]MXO61722.1 bifunctional 2-C-methyl-D-erythritol 4-phosphate cytidylyltransferase/2-C-methyl-D-erythritol 2,4-cyclodiphosphate synthase [Qipengyuania oceanensis]